MEPPGPLCCLGEQPYEHALDYNPDAVFDGAG